MLSSRITLTAALLLLPNLLLAASSKAPAAVDVSVVDLTVQAADGSQVESVSIEALKLDNEAMSPDATVRRTSTAPSTIQLELAPGAWRITASTPGYWAPAVEVKLEQAGSSKEGSDQAQSNQVDLSLWPASEVRGQWSLPADGGLREYEQRPRQMKLRFRRPESTDPAAAQLPPDALLEGESTCRLLVTGQFRCPVPIGAWNLRLGALNFAPAYLWRQQIDSLPLRVGELPLRRGGSVSGWLPTCASAEADATCRVEIERTAGGQVLDPRTRGEMQDLVLEGSVHENGFFQIVGVPAGNYALAATQPGFAPGSFFPILVVENRESELREPLILEPPLELRVQVEPALDPNDQPWTMELLALGEQPGHQREVDGGEPVGLGIWQWSSLPAGDYKLYLGDGAGQLWHSTTIELAPGNETIDVDLPMVQVEGRVLLGDEGLRARLHWPVRLLMESDEEGYFSGLLPRTGTYERVELRSSDPPIRWKFPGVVVDIDPETSKAWVELRLPDTFVTGVVVAADGTAVTDAAILPLADGMAGGSVQTDAEGRFRLRGLPEGRAILQAESALGSSDPVSVEISEDVEQEVRLVIRASTEIEGRLTSPNGGGIPGAQVIAWSPGMMSLEPVVTRGDGSFVVRLPETATSASFKIQAPGFPFATRIVDISDRSRVELEIAQGQAATLLIESIQEHLDPTAPISLTLWHNGVFLSLGELLQWARLHGDASDAGDHHRIGRVEAGEWSICLYPLAALDPFDLRPSPQYCRSGHVAAGGELVLESTALIGKWGVGRGGE